MGGLVLSEERKESKKKICYQYAVELNPQIFLLIFLAKVYRFDLETLLLLYDRIGDDIFYVFFLLAGRTIIVPKHTRMLRLMQFSKQACEAILRGDEVESATAQESEVVAFLESLYDKKSKKIIIRTEIPHVTYITQRKADNEEQQTADSADSD